MSLLKHSLKLLSEFNLKKILVTNFCSNQIKIESFLEIKQDTLPKSLRSLVKKNIF